MSADIENTKDEFPYLLAVETPNGFETIGTFKTPEDARSHLMLAVAVDEAFDLDESRFAILRKYETGLSMTVEVAAPKVSLSGFRHRVRTRKETENDTDEANSEA